VVEDPHECAGEGDADEAADAGEEEALPEELGQDCTFGCANGLEDADLAGALGDRDEHDVDDADCAEAEGDDADTAEEDVHGVEDGADHVLFLDGVPLVEGVLVGGGEAVVAGDDAVDGGDGLCRVSLDGGLILDGGDCVAGNVFALHGEELLHRGEGHVELLVVAVIVAAGDGADLANDAEGDVVDGDGFAEDGAAREEQLGRFEAEDDNAAVVDQVVGVDEAAFVHGDEADGGEVGLDAHDLSRGVGEGADGVEVASVEQGGDGAQLGEGTQIGFVAEGELVGPHAGVLVSDSGDRAVPHHDDVVAEGGEVAMLTGAEALPEADQDEQRAYPPGNAKHGEEGAQLVGQHGAEDLAESVRKILHR